MTEGPNPGDPLPDPRANPLDPLGTAPDPLVQGDPLLDALERSIQDPTGKSGPGEQEESCLDPLGKMLDQVEDSVFNKTPRCRSSTPCQDSRKLPQVVSHQGTEIVAVPNPTIPYKSGCEPTTGNPSLPVQEPSVPKSVAGPPRPGPQPHRDGISASGLRRNRMGGSGRRGVRYGRGQLPTSLKGRKRGRLGTGLTQSNVETCPRKGFEYVSCAQHCQPCPDYQQWSQGQAKECLFWWRIKQELHRVIGQEDEDTEEE